MKRAQNSSSVQKRLEKPEKRAPNMSSARKRLEEPKRAQNLSSVLKREKCVLSFRTQLKDILRERFIYINYHCQEWWRGTCLCKLVGRCVSVWCVCVVHVFVCGCVSVVYGGVQTCEACVFVYAFCGTFGPSKLKN